jgi:hypothetical protein
LELSLKPGLEWLQPTQPATKHTVKGSVGVLYHQQVNLYDSVSDPDSWHGRHDGLYWFGLWSVIPYVQFELLVFLCLDVCSRGTNWSREGFEAKSLV